MQTHKDIFRLLILFLSRGDAFPFLAQWFGESNYGLESCSKRQDAPTGIQTVHKIITNITTAYYTVTTPSEQCVIFTLEEH